MFLNPNIFSILDSNGSNLLDLRNLQEQVKKTFWFQKLFRPFTVKIVQFISKIVIILELQSRISKVFSQSLEQFFLTVGQNNFGNEIP